MRRREFIAGIAASTLWSAGVIAQSARKPVIGVLFHSNPEPFFGHFRVAMARLGYRDGDTVEFHLLFANGSELRLTELAAELVERKVDVIFAITTPAVIAAKNATSSIPIVISSADPVGTGLVASLAHPRGNVTGTSSATPEVAGAILGLLREAIPTVRRIGVLVNVSDPFHRLLVERIEAANRTVNVDLRVYGMVRPAEMEALFERMAVEGVDAAIIQPTLPRPAAVALGLRHKIPTASPIAGYARQGGFLSYSGKLTETVAVSAAQIDQILKGTKPADIAVRQPTRFELTLNLKTAQALGIMISPLLLAKADEVIE